MVVPEIKGFVSLNWKFNILIISWTIWRGNINVFIYETWRKHIYWQQCLKYMTSSVKHAYQKLNQLCVYYWSVIKSQMFLVKLCIIILYYFFRTFQLDVVNYKLAIYSQWTSFMPSYHVAVEVERSERLHNCLSKREPLRDNL